MTKRNVHGIFFLDRSTLVRKVRYPLRIWNASSIAGDLYRHNETRFGSRAVWIAILTCDLNRGRFVSPQRNAIWIAGDLDGGRFESPAWNAIWIAGDLYRHNETRFESRAICIAKLKAFWHTCDVNRIRITKAFHLYFFEAVLCSSRCGVKAAAASGF